MREKLIVTGITGFVGVNLKDSLKKDYQITGVSRHENLEYDIISYSDLSTHTLNNTKALIHLAGKAHDLKKVASDKVYYEANTALTQKVFDLFLSSTCEVFIYMSSVKAVRDSVEGVLYETHDPAPSTVYGKSKLAAEQYILKLISSKGKRIYILRPCMIHGRNNKGNLNLLYKLILNNIPYPLGSFENKRSYLSVDNLSFYIEQLLTKNIKSGVYNVADKGAISTVDLVKIIGEGIGKKAVIFSMPIWLINIGKTIGDKMNLPFRSENIEKLTESYVVSSEKIRKAISEDPPVTLKDGLLTTIRSFKENN